MSPTALTTHYATSLTSASKNVAHTWSEPSGPGLPLEIAGCASSDPKLRKSMGLPCAGEAEGVTRGPSKKGASQQSPTAHFWITSENPTILPQSSGFHLAYF